LAVEVKLAFVVNEPLALSNLSCHQVFCKNFSIQIKRSHGSQAQKAEGGMELR
jgi:hypothetical protein